MPDSSDDEQDENPDLRPCVLCGRPDNNRYKFGEKCSSTFNGSDVVVHYLCCLFSCNLVRASDNDEDGIRGFAVADILREVRRGKKLKCSFCRKTGATLGCCVGNTCKKMYHLPCGQEHGVQLIARDSFQSFCSRHSKFKHIEIDSEITDCVICSAAVDQTDFPDVIQCRCCKHVYHKKCVRKFAYISGMHHFKCSSCNHNDRVAAGLTNSQARVAKKCNDRYVKLVQEHGIFIPEKDADWELDGSFEEHDQEFGECDIEDEDGKSACVCEKGTKYDEPKHKRNKWYIALCSLCAAHGCHRFCRRIAAKDCETWICDTCSEILTKSKENRKSSHTGTSSAARNSQNKNTNSSPSSSGHVTPARKITSDSQQTGTTEKNNRTSGGEQRAECRDQPIPLPRNSGDQSVRPHQIAAKIVPSPVTPVSRQSSKRRTSPIEFSAPTQTSTPKVPKMEPIDVVTLSDSD